MRAQEPILPSIDRRRAGFDAQRADDDTVIERPRKPDRQRLARAGRRARRASSPRASIASSTAGPARKMCRCAGLERQPVRIGPRPARCRSHSAAPARSGRPALPVGKDVVLDAAGIEEQGVARVVRAPEVGVDGKKRARLDALGLAVSGPDSSTSFTKSRPLAVAHRRRRTRCTRAGDSPERRRPTGARPAPVVGSVATGGSRTTAVTAQAWRGRGSCDGSKTTRYARPGSKGNSGVNVTAESVTA